MPGVEQNTIWITDQNGDVTTSANSGTSGVWEEVIDLTVPTGVEYQLRPSNELGSREGLRFRLDLDDSGDSDLPDNAEVKFVGEDPTEEDQKQIGTTRSLRQFNNADQYNADEVFRFDVNKRYTFKEDAHFKVYIDSGTAVSWSDSYFELELVRFS